MDSFIENVLKDLNNKSTAFSELIFILPSKRAGIFLKNKLHNYISKASFAPEIISVEDFVQNLSRLRQISGVELLFEFYSSYKKITPKNKIESFETFSKWAQILIQDFNEIDRYLINSDKIFDYLGAIQELNHWSLEDKKTTLITNYLSFWKTLKHYYNQLSYDLIAKETAYQGLIYKEATKHVETYIQNTDKTHIFLGFNALNSAEKLIIQELIQNNVGRIYWDIDSQFINNKIHSAGLFARQHQQKWPFYKTNTFDWITNTYKNQKNINVVGCPKSLGQSKYVGNLLKQLSDKNNSLNSTAIVLGDEQLLMPVLNALPNGISAVNVTMGLPLKSIPIASLFEQLFAIHRTRVERFYFKDVVSILSHQMIQHVFESSEHIIKTTHKNNISYLSLVDIIKLSHDSDIKLIQLLFGDWHISMTKTINNCLELIKNIKDGFNDIKTEKRLELEYLYRFNTLFNEIASMNSKFGFINDVSTLFSVYKQLLSSETLDFQGEPLEGLQIMGMLESRVLDFETVIITSVNEGILPGGKTNNSFIPFDLKINKELPTFKEKDAVYTYHFYSLIQRAKNVYLIYNTEVDVLKGGEKSRFITQLEIEGIHNIKHKIISPSIPKIDFELLTIKKNVDIINKLKSYADKGFSPSSLTNYIRNPIDFYFEKVLGVKNTEEVEETVAANTLGTVVHNSLEDFYKPFEGQFLKIEDIKKMKSLIDTTITKHFTKAYKQGDITSGKNLIIFEIAKRYIVNFLNSEIKLLENENTLKIIAIEVDNTVPLNIPELDFPINITGKVDRVDELNGVTRIIDYKSGKVEQSNVEIVDWNLLNTDYKKYSKSFQVLCYAYMMKKQNLIKLPVEAGIISFKNLKQGFLKFAEKESTHSRKKNYEISEETLQHFEIQLKSLILEICNPNTDFIEKELN